MNANFIQQVEMSDDEKFDMYMKLDKEEIIRMHIELEKHIKPIQVTYIPNSTGNPPIEYYLGIANSKKVF